MELYWARLYSAAPDAVLHFTLNVYLVTHGLSRASVNRTTLSTLQTIRYISISGLFDLMILKADYVSCYVRIKFSPSLKLIRLFVTNLIPWATLGP